MQRREETHKHHKERDHSKQEDKERDQRKHEDRERDQRKHEDKDRGWEKIKDKHKDQAKDKDRPKFGLAIGKIMSSHTVITPEEQRIHELDQDVERMFDVKKRLGKGAYGIVWKAIERQRKNTVALKKIFDAFRDETDAQRTYREVIFLRAFRHHPNIIRLMDVFKAGNNLDFYLVFEFMESDLHNVIKRGDILKDIHKRFVMYQLVNAIKYMHSGNVVHRDLKPSNILIDSKCRLKVADFGLARTLNRKRNTEFDDLEDGTMLTDYVATRWYRAPEILVASRNYTKAVDMWSLGCILGEMIRQKPIFQGTSTINQIEKIVTVLPDVTQEDIDSIGASFGTVLLSKKINRDRRHSLDDMMRHCCEDAMSLLKSLLVLDPQRRLTARSAILHPYVSRFRTASADMELRSDVHPPLRDDVRYHIDDYRSSLYETVCQEQWSSSHRERSSSPLSNRESRAPLTATSTTTKHSRSVSRTRTLSASQTIGKHAMGRKGVSTLLRTITHSWTQHSGHKQTASTTMPACCQQHQQAVVESPPESRRVPPKQAAPARVKIVTDHKRTAPHPSSSSKPKQPAAATSSKDAKLRHTAEVTLARNTREALRRELDAVAATAARKKNMWQSQNQAHEQFHHKAEAQVKALLNTKLPAYTAQLEKVKWGGGDAATPRDDLPRSRALRKNKDKECKSLALDKELERKREKERDRKDRERERDRDIVREREKYSQEYRRSTHNLMTCKITKVPAVSIPDPNTRKQWEPLPDEMKRRRHEKKKLAVRKTETEELLEEMDESRKEVKERTRAPSIDLGARCQRLLQLANNGTTDMVLGLMTRKLRRLSEQKELAQAEKKQNGDQSEIIQRLESGAVLCYRARISYLESEMANCKEQLLKFLVENQEMLTHRRLRYHFNLLQPDMGEEEEEEEEKKPEQEQELLTNYGDASGDSGQSYDSFRVEQSKLRNLQVQEFLSRDESNDFELPDLGNVYKAKSFHSFTQTSGKVSPLSSPDSGLSHSQEAEYAHGDHCFLHKTTGKLPPSSILDTMFSPEKGQGDVHRHGSRYDHMRMRAQDIEEFLSKRKH